MTTITRIAGITSGTTADGRIRYASCNDGPVIDGRPAWRKTYRGGGAVDATDWAAACDLMRAVDAADSAYGKSLTDAAEESRARREAALEGIEAVRGGAYDPYTY